MIKNIVQSIGGIGLYGMISMLLFFLVFAGTLVWVLRLKRSYIHRMKDLPLEPDETPPQNGDPHA